MEDTELPLLKEKENEVLEQKIVEDIKKKIREGFIYKVYILLLVQLALTFGFVVLANEIKTLEIFILSHRWLFYVMVFTPLIIIIYFLIDPKKTKQVPINYILLFFFSMTEGYSVAYFTLSFQKWSVYFAMLLTLVAVLVLSLYAFITQRDFTVLGGILWVSLIILIFGNIINLFFFRLHLLKCILEIIGIILFSLYLLYDTQLIIGNKQSKLSEDDYILAVMMLYLDIINLFLYFLSLSGKNK